MNDNVVALAPNPAAGTIADKWTEEKKLAFKLLKPAAIVVVATDGPVSVTLFEAGSGAAVRRIGHNRAVWPAKVTDANAWRDAVSVAYDRNPFFFLGVQIRTWTASAEARDRLGDAVVDLIARRSEEHGGCDELMSGFSDLGADLDLAAFELAIHDVARRLGIAAWDDVGLSIYLDRILRRANEIRRERAMPFKDALARARGDA